jgi:hypothetical protein
MENKGLIFGGVAISGIAIGIFIGIAIHREKTISYFQKILSDRAFQDYLNQEYPMKKKITKTK